jgi:hypothetical protein
VDHLSGLKPCLREFPYLLDPKLEPGRVLAHVELETRDQILGQVPSRAFAEDRDPGLDVGSRFVVGLLLALRAMPLSLHADDLVLYRTSHRRNRRCRPRSLDQPSHPLAELDMETTKAIAQGRRGDGVLVLLPW